MAASCLQMDVGNSSAKWRLVVDGVPVARGRYVSGDADSADALLNCAELVEQIWISSVAGSDAEDDLSKLLEARWQVRPWFARTQGEVAGLRNSYAEPGRMGVDRWLAMLGARSRCDGSLCVVDAGSALTIDFVDREGCHSGGYIIPGPHLMERALLLDTDRVRFEEDVGYSLEPGVSTAEAVRHGIALAQAGAVSVALKRFYAEDDTALFYCGGGGQELRALSDCGGEYIADLVFEGLEVQAEVS